MGGIRRTSWVSVLGVLAPCSTSGGSDTEASGQDQDNPSSSSATSSAQGTSSSDAQESEQASAAPAEKLGDLGARKGGKYKDSTIALKSVTANDGTMTVNFSLNNISDSNKIQVPRMFSNGISEKRDGEDAPDTDHYSADGVFVTTSEKKRYLVGREDDGVCARSSNLSGAFVTKGQTVTLSAVSRPLRRNSSLSMPIPSRQERSRICPWFGSEAPEPLPYADPRPGHRRGVLTTGDPAKADTTTAPGNEASRDVHYPYPVEEPCLGVADLVFDSATEDGAVKEEGPKIILTGEVLFAPDRDTLAKKADQEFKHLSRQGPGPADR